MNLKQWALRSALWSAVDNATTALFAFISLVVLAAVLSPADFGVFSIALSVVEIAAVPAKLFFQDALVQRKELTENHIDSAWAGSIILGLLCFALLWVAFPYVASQVGDPRLTSVGRVLSSGIVLTGISSVLSAQQMRVFGFRVLALRTFTGRTLGTLMGIGAALMGFGVWALVVQQLAVIALGTVALLIHSDRPPRISLNVQALKELSTFGALSTTSFLVMFSTKRLYLYLIGVCLGTDAAGLLTIAFRMVDTLWSVSANAMTQVLFSAMSRIQHERERLLGAYSNSLHLAATLLLPVFTGIGLLSEEVITLTVGAKWLDASTAVVVLCLLIYVSLPRSFVTVLMTSTGRLGALTLANSGAILVVLIGVLETGFLTVRAALWTWLAACVLDFSMGVVAVALCFRISPHLQLQPMLRPAIASVAMAATVVVARRYSAFEGTLSRAAALATIGAAAYVTMMLVIDRGAALRGFKTAARLISPRRAEESQDFGL